MKIRKEVKIGLMVLISIGLLIWGAQFLKGTNLFNKSRKFFAIYEHVDGLSASNPVVINGYKVGQVESIDFMNDNSGNLLVQFSVTKRDFKIPKDSKAKIVSSDILGSKSIDLQLGEAIEELQDLDTLEASIEASLTEAVNQQIAPLKKKAEELISTVDSAIIVVQSIFNKKARGDIGASFTSIRNSLQAFETTMNRVDGLVKQEREHIAAIFQNVESITKNLAQNNERLTQSLTNIEAISDSLAGANLKQTVNNASIAMEEVAGVMEKINSGQGSLGQLINNDTLYTNLEAAANDLDQLLLDMRLNPERYVHFSIFGRKKKEASDDQSE
jgi:phospholipid/cholesterol/gamma-HCH transport system substrate-binding protein